MEASTYCSLMLLPAESVGEEVEEKVLWATLTGPLLGGEEEGSYLFYPYTLVLRLAEVVMKNIPFGAASVIDCGSATAALNLVPLVALTHYVHQLRPTTLSFLDLMQLPMMVLFGSSPTGLSHNILADYLESQTCCVVLSSPI